MAKVIKSKKKSGGKKTRTVTVTKTKKVYVAAKNAKRRFKRAASQKVGIKDAAFAVAGAGAGAVGGAFVVSQIPASIPAPASNGIVAAIGAAVAAIGMKKRNKLLMGAGLGMGAVGVRGLVAQVVPTMAGFDAIPVNTYTPALAAPFAAPFGAPIAAGECMAAPFDGDDNDLL